MRASTPRASRWPRAARSSGAAPSNRPVGRATSSTGCPGYAAWAKRPSRARAWPRSTPLGSRSRAATSGHSGYELETVLRDDYRIAVEAADPLNVVLNVTYGDSHADLEKLVAAFRDYAGRRAEQAGGGGSTACTGLLAHAPAFTRQVLSPREAFFAPSVALPLAECAGRVSAEMVTPYPPGIPVLGPGEAISDEIVAYLHEGARARLKVHRPEDRALQSLRVVA